MTSLSAQSLPSLLKDGTRHMQGVDEAIFRFISACKQTCQLIGTSYGPFGRSKFIVNQHGKLFFTSDSGLILREVGVEHPAAKTLIMFADLQRRKFGDGGGWVVLMAGELLTMAEGLLKAGLTQSQVVDGFKMATAKATELLEAVTFNGTIENVLSTAITSKQPGLESILCPLVKQAIEIVSDGTADKKRFSLAVDNVRIVKIMGSNVTKSSVIKGMLFCREPEGMVKSAFDCKVAVFSCPLGASRTEAKGTVLFSSAQDMLSFSHGEEQILQSQIQSLAQAGVKVIVCGDTISDVSLHFLDKLGLMGVRISSKHDLRRLAKAVGATVLTRLVVPSEEELGHGSVSFVELGADRCILVESPRSEGASPSPRLATILLRGSSPNQMDSLERAINDALFNAKAFFEHDRRVVTGGGVTEALLVRQLDEFASACAGISQYVCKAFAFAFEAIPKMLLENSGGQVSSDDSSSTVEDLFIIKRDAMINATQAVVTILSVNECLMKKPASANAPQARPMAPMDAD